MTVSCVAVSVLSLGITIFLSDRIFFDKLGKLMLMLALMVTMTACTGRKGGEAAEQDANGLYASGNTMRAEAPEAETASRKAKTVVMYEMPAKLADRPEQILKRKGYTTSYNSRTKTPNWVAWHLTKSHTYGSNQRSQEVFACS